jgi:pseudouridine-5'-monophosphatase
MDGLMIDREDILTLYHNILLSTYNAGPMTWDIKSQLQGRPASEATPRLLSFNLSNVSPESYATALRAIHKRGFPKAQPLPGVETLLQTIKSTSNSEKGRKIHIVLATSSHEGTFKLKTGHLESLFEVFPKERRVLGDDKRIPTGKGKPSPDIYLVALRAINETLEGEEEIRPEECLVFEDGVPGVIAGRRAGMRVVWVPHPGLAQECLGRDYHRS